jgi:hypothetical protein
VLFEEWYMLRAYGATTTPDIVPWIRLPCLPDTMASLQVGASGIRQYMFTWVLDLYNQPQYDRCVANVCLSV